MQTLIDKLMNHAKDGLEVKLSVDEVRLIIDKINKPKEIKDHDKYFIDDYILLSRITKPLFPFPDKTIFPNKVTYTKYLASKEPEPEPDFSWLSKPFVKRSKV